MFVCLVCIGEGIRLVSFESLTKYETLTTYNHQNWICSYCFVSGGDIQLTKKKMNQQIQQKTNKKLH